MGSNRKSEWNRTKLNTHTKRADEMFFCCCCFVWVVVNDEAESWSEWERERDIKIEWEKNNTHTDYTFVDTKIYTLTSVKALTYLKQNSSTQKLIIICWNLLPKIHFLIFHLSHLGWLGFFYEWLRECMIICLYGFTDKTDYGLLLFWKNVTSRTLSELLMTILRALICIKPSIWLYIYC